MQKLPSRSSVTSNFVWQDLYQAALFETDPNKVPERIAQAEQAILARFKELFVATHDHIEEDQVLDDALYALHALRNCVVSDVTAA
jgi:hypothetical protein